MRAVVQRVRDASVSVGDDTVASIGPGIVVLLGIAVGDTAVAVEQLARKVARLRIFENAEARFDRSLLDVHGEGLVVSQFTLIADTRKGNRPSFTGAAPHELAQPLYERFCEQLAATGISVRRGVFGAKMALSLTNDGPVTIVLG